MKNDSRVAVLGYREGCGTQTGVLVKCQRWVAGKMTGGVIELDLAWLRPAGEYWYNNTCPFDDDIPF